MEVVGDELRLHVEELTVVLDPLPEGLQRLVVLHIPNVVTREGLAVLRQAKRVLELPAAGQGVTGEPPGESQRRRRVAARAPEWIGSPRGYLKHAVVAARVDGAVVHEKVVRYVAELLERLLVPVRDRLVGVVAAGHDEGDARVAKQQVVQRRVR